VPEPIEVRIDDIDMLETHLATMEPLILARLKEAGIPAKGTFFFEGLDSGTLYQLHEAHQTVYVWHPPR
jgi:hypothetical protein